MVLECIKNNYHSIYHEYNVVCYKMKIHVVGNIFTSRHALKNEANVILLFGDSVLGRSRKKHQYSLRISQQYTR